MNHMRQFWPVYSALILLAILFTVVPLKRERAADGTPLGRRTLLYLLRHGGSAAEQQNRNIQTNGNANAPVANSAPPATNTPKNANTQPPTSGATSFGVIAGRNASDDQVLPIIKDLGVQTLRVNYRLGDNQNPDLAKLLANGFDLVVMFKNDDPSNSSTTYGTPVQWPSAGFPYVDKARYEQDIQSALRPILPYLAQGRKVYAQSENEVSDASVSPKAKYWRGTTQQYLLQLAAFREAVKALDVRLAVALSGFASSGLDAVVGSGASTADAQKFYGKLLAAPEYDVADLHFYGCVGDIAAKASWVKARLRSGTGWISTENGGPDYRCASTSATYDQNPTLYLQTEAQQVPERLSACSSNGGSVCLWLSLFDMPNEASVFTHMGLLTATTPPQQKLAYGAFRQFVASQ